MFLEHKEEICRDLAQLQKNGVITETGKTKYRMRFRILELWEKWFGD